MGVSTFAVVTLLNSLLLQLIGMHFTSHINGVFQNYTMFIELVAKLQPNTCCYGIKCEI